MISDDHCIVKPKPQKTFFENIQSQLKLPLFATTLKSDGPGTYDFGFVNESKFMNDISYVDVDTSRGRWGFKTNGYIVGNGKVIYDFLDGIAGTLLTSFLVSPGFNE